MRTILSSPGLNLEATHSHWLTLNTNIWGPSCSQCCTLETLLFWPAKPLVPHLPEPVRPVQPPALLMGKRISVHTELVLPR